MSSIWIVTNKTPQEKDLLDGTSLIFRAPGFSVYCDQQEKVHNRTQQGRPLSLIINGFVLPRLEDFEKYENLSMHDLVFQLFQDHGTGFIRYLKGNFEIVLLTDTGFFIFNDRLGVRKFFYHENGDQYIFSNDLKTISTWVRLDLDLNHITIHALLHHYIDGATFLKGVYHSTPASRVTFIGRIQMDHYWHLSSLLGLPKEDISFQDFAHTLNSIAKSYITFLKPKNITMTLTGGLDSRTLLSNLFHLGLKPRTFTFGDPNSADGYNAGILAERFDLTHRNHFNPNPTADWFDGLADEIVGFGNSLIHIHRAHRLDAIKNQVAEFLDTDIMFVGSMGGEGIRGVHYDDLIITEFVRRNWEENQDRGDLISRPVQGGSRLANGDLWDGVVRFYGDRQICENLGE